MTSLAAMSLLDQPEFPKLCDYVIAATGLDYYHDHKDALTASLAERMDISGVADCGSYLAMLQNGHGPNAELDGLVELLTIGETYFFRQPGLFELLKSTVLPDIIRRNAGRRRIRIWSAGCSVGAEAYSVSILLRRDLDMLTSGWDVSILGTDINRKFLASAAEGRFESWALRGLSDEVLTSCFRVRDKTWEINPRYKEGVSFQFHNLARHPLPSLLHNLFAFDLILCRNVLIYFGSEIIRRVAECAFESLVDGGWLAVGHAELSADLFWQFETHSSADAVIYRREHGTAPQSIGVPPQPSGQTDQHDAHASAWPVGGAFSWPCLPVGQHPAKLIKIDAPRLPSTREAGVTARESPPNVELVNIRQLADRGEINAALKWCQASLARNRMDPVRHFYHALLLDQVAGHAQAEEALRLAIYLDRNFDLAHYYLGLVQLKQHHKTEAARSFRNVLKLLARHRPDELIRNSDGLAAGELGELAQMHLEMIESR